MSKRAAIRVCFATLLLVGSAIGATKWFDALQQAQREYQNESQLATAACTTRLAKAGRRLLDSYDRSLDTAKINGDAVRMKTLQVERTQLKAAVDRLEKEGVPDPISEFLSLLSGAYIRANLSREAMVAYFGFNEGCGKVTLNAVSKAPTSFGDALWSKDDGEPVLDFHRPAAVLAPLGLGLGPQWTVVMRAKFPFDMAGHTWASLLVAGVGAHHVIVNRSTEIGVFRGDFVGSGLLLKDLQGWHTLTVRVEDGKTTFWIDGLLKGTANAAITDPIQTFGNAPWSAGGDFQNFGVVMDGVVVYSRALADKEIGAIGNRGF